MTVSAAPHTAAASLPASRTRRAIISPGIDALCAGGFSMLVLLPLLASGRAEFLLFAPGVQAWVGAMVNMPHFLASYRMVYRTPASIRAHPWAAIYVPSVLVVSCIGAVFAAQWTPIPISTLLTISGSYLAWHYTGQAWGMVATFTYLAGLSFTKLERRLIRGSLIIMMAWHVTWFLNLTYVDYLDLSAVYRVLSYVTLLALVMGLAGFALQRARTGRVAPLRAWIPWVAIFVWYGVMAKVGLPALFIVQIAHAVQYLIFPFRVEVNRTKRNLPGGAPGQLVTAHMALYVGALLAGSIVAAIALPLGAMAVVSDWLGSRPGQYTGFAISAFFNIHHYFTDGVVWKLRNPEVRQDLFGHLAEAQPVGAKAPSRPSRRR